MTDSTVETGDDYNTITNEIIKIARTSVLGVSRIDMVRDLLLEQFTPTVGEPAIDKLSKANQVILLLSYTLGAVLDDTKEPDPTPRPLRRLAIVEDDLRAMDD